MKRRPLPLVEVEWVDSVVFCETAWFKTDDVKGNATAKCFTVGYVLEETDANLSLVASVSMDDGEVSEVGGVKVIPKVAIVRRRNFK